MQNALIQLLSEGVAKEFIDKYGTASSPRELRKHRLNVASYMLHEANKPGSSVHTAMLCAVAKALGPLYKEHGNKVDDILLSSFKNTVRSYRKDLMAAPVPRYIGLYGGYPMYRVDLPEYIIPYQLLRQLGMQEVQAAMNILNLRVVRRHDNSSGDVVGYTYYLVSKEACF